MIPRRTDLTQTAFGLKDGRVFAPGDVPSGLACGCTCFGCGAQLVAKKGAVNRWHFAHHIVEIGDSCAESAIHAAAKQVLLDHNFLQLPDMRAVVSGQTSSGVMLFESSQLAETRIVRFDSSRSEVWETNVRPDVVGYRGERRLLVEMYFRHKVDEVKKQKLAQLQLPAIEIDLSDLDISVGFEGIAQRVLHETEFKSWLYFPGEEEERRILRKRLALRIEQANRQRNLEQAADVRRQETREKRLEQEANRQEAATQQYRRLSRQKKEADLRERLGIGEGWPYYLRKKSEYGSAIVEPAMIWQAALFARFIFKKSNPRFELKQASILNWVVARFDIGNSSVAAVHGEVRRYLGYMTACGFLSKLPYNPYESQGYIVVHGEVAPPDRKSTSNGGAADPPMSRNISAGGREEPTATPRVHWTWRPSWPPWRQIRADASRLLAETPNREHLQALLEELSPFSRPDDPLECAAILQQWDVPEHEVMAMLEKLGLVLKSSLPERHLWL